MLLAAAACTTFYSCSDSTSSSRQFSAEEQKHHLHESPPASEAVVLWIWPSSFVVSFSGSDVVASTFGGSNYFGDWLAAVVGAQAREETLGEFGILATIATGASLASMALAWLFYAKGFSPTVGRLRRAAPLQNRRQQILRRRILRHGDRAACAGPPITWRKAVDTLIITIWLLVTGIAFFVAGIGKLVKVSYCKTATCSATSRHAGRHRRHPLRHHQLRRLQRVEFEINADGESTCASRTAAIRNKQKLQYRVAWERGRELSSRRSPPSFATTTEGGGKKNRWSTRWERPRAKSVTLP